MGLDELNRRYDVVDHEIAKATGVVETLTQRCEVLTAEAEGSAEAARITAQARTLLELIVRATDIRIRDYIEPLVTEALEFVFSQGLHFHLYSVSRRNQVEYDFVITRSDEIEALFLRYMGDPEKHAAVLEQLVKETRNINFMYGGAVNQVLSLVLRFVLVELFRLKGPVLLDEPSSAVGEDYSARLGQLISSLSARFGRQIILVTHSKTLASYAEISYSVGKVDGVSQVKRTAE